jgi:ATP-dependent RNA helicase DDX54/DBP10
VKVVKTENGVRLPASYRSGRFEEWKAKSKVSLPRIGETELQRAKPQSAGPGGRKFRHNKVTAPKQLDKSVNNYERRVRQLRKRQEGAGVGDDGKAAGSSSVSPRKGKKQGKPSRYGGKSFTRVKSELKTSDQIQKQRKITGNRRAKNARPSKKHRR